MKIGALVATENFTQNKRRFASEALDDIVGQLPGKFIFWEFSALPQKSHLLSATCGQVISARRTPAGVEIVAGVLSDLRPGYLVLSCEGTLEKTPEGDVIPRVPVVSALGRTDDPADRMLLPWWHIEEET